MKKTFVSSAQQTKTAQGEHAILFYVLNNLFTQRLCISQKKTALVKLKHLNLLSTGGKLMLLLSMP